jgi:hypothetical protein
MNDERAEFLAGARPQDVVLYFANDAVDDPEQLATHGESVEGGLVLTLEGSQGRSVFGTATGTDPMGPSIPTCWAGPVPTTRRARATPPAFCLPSPKSKRTTWRDCTRRGT